LTIISVTLLFILFRAGLFSPGPINVQDYPLHYFAAYNIAHDLLPNLQSTVGPTQHFQLGYTLHFDYPVLTSVTVSFVYYILQQIPLWAVFRAVVGFSFCLPVFAVYFLSKKVGLESGWAVVSSFLYLSWSNTHLISGMFSSYLSLGIGLVSLYLLIEYIESGSKHFMILSSLAASLSFLAHSLVFVPLTLVFLSLIYMYKDQFNKRDILTIALVLSCTSLFYLTAVLNRLDYIIYMFSQFPEIFIHLYNFEYIFWNNFYIQSSLILLLSSPLLLLGYDNKKIDSILYSAILIFITMFLIDFLQAPANQNQLLTIFANVFEIDRVIFSSRPIWSVLCTYSICNFFKEKGRWVQITKVLTVGAASLFIFPYILYMVNAWHTSDDLNFVLLHNDTLENYFSLEFEDGVLGFHPDQEVMEAYDFLAMDTDNSARVLWEEALYGQLGGNIKSMAPYFTDRLFVGGVYLGVILEGNHGAYDGVFFGKNITDYEFSELRNKLDEFNVGWIAVWTGESKSYFGAQPDFENIFTSSKGLIHIYGYTNSRREFVLSGEAELVEITNNKITLDVQEESRLLLSFRYEPDWHAYLGGEELHLERDGILISIDGRPGKLEIVYEENLLIRFGKYVTIFSFSLTLLLSIYLFKRSRIIS
jgi:hypothetical protein